MVYLSYNSVALPMSPRAATTLVFALNGAVIGTWIAHIPYMQDRLDVSAGALGLALLSMALGALASMPLTGQILDRVPSATVVRCTALVFCLLAPLPLLAPSLPVLALCLVVFGAANGAMDVAMNAHGVAVERTLERPVLSSLHAGWSLGNFLAAACAALAAAGGLDPRLEAALLTVPFWGMAFVVTARLGTVSAHGGDAGSGFALPSRAVLLLGVCAFLAMTTEGAMSDWSGVYLRRELDAGPAAATTAYVGFTLGMLFGRLVGDRVNERFGPLALLRGGMLIVSLALGGVLLLGVVGVAVIGYVAIGFGVANAVPIMFSAAGRVPPAGPSLAAVFTVGYLGFVAGPPLIGFLADAIGIGGALAIVSCAGLVVAAASGRAVRAPAPIA